MIKWLKEPVTKDFLGGILVGWGSAVLLAVLTIIAHWLQ